MSTKTNTKTSTKTTLLFLLTIVLTGVLIGCKSKSVDFVEPKDGAQVGQTFNLKFAVEGYEIRPAGEVVEGTGHHHLIINGGPVEKGVVVPADETHIHYGKGQTETSVTLPPGEHRLTLQFADGLHQSYGPEMSKTIKVTVK